MCGIAGFVGKRGALAASGRRRLTRAADLLTHRGPDERGIWLGDGVGLACRRLAVVDIAEGQQPIRHEPSGTVVAFNGEIYSYRELRAELERGGYRFETTGDTEVLLAGWLAWGEGVFDRVDGMMACAIWLPATRELVLARDRFGKKPLYYAPHDGALWFASEMKSLLGLPGFERRLDAASSEHFLLFDHVFDPMTPFEGISALPPAHILRIRDGAIDEARPRRYWSVPIGAEAGAPQTIEEASEELSGLFGSAVARRTTGDMPVAALLSGGVDSSLVCHALTKVGEIPREVFSITFDDPRIDESAQQRLVAEHLGVTRHAFDFDARRQEVVESYPEALWFGEYADHSYEQDVLFRHVTALAADHGYKVLLGGEGADELFRGYEHYRVHPHQRRYLETYDFEAVPESLGYDDDHFADLAEDEAACRRAFGVAGAVLSADFPFSQLLEPGAFSTLAEEIFVAPPAAPALRCVGLAGPRPADEDSLDALQFGELHTRLPGYILRTLDRYSMASSVEVRCPFMDHRLHEWFARLPRHLRDRAPGDKPLLTTLARDRLPAQITSRRKQGFRAPCLLTHSLRSPGGRDQLAALLGSDAVEGLDVVKPEWVAKSLPLFWQPARDRADDLASQARAKILERVLSLRLLRSVFVEEFDTYQTAHLERHGVSEEA